MGLSKSKEVNKDLALFSQDEQEILQRSANELLNGKKYIDCEVLKSWLCSEVSLPEQNIFERICDLMTSGSGNHVTVDNFLHVAAVMTKGVSEEKSEMIVYFTSRHKHHTHLRNIIDLCRLLLVFYVNLASKQTPLQSWKALEKEGSEKDVDSIERLATFLASELAFQGTPPRETVGEVPCEDSKYDVSTVNVWFNKCYQIAEIFELFSHRIFHLPWSPSAPLIPLCKEVPLGIYPPWLGTGELILINTALPISLRSEWRLIFSTRVHGESFSSLMGSILSKGPTVIIIQDEKGHIFGGFASSDWTVNPHFTGTEKNFVFSLFPRMAVYASTGFNSHYQYLNIQQQTFPNGLGMGGQLNYFGFWIDAEFGKGKCSPTCTTYGCPQLSAEPDFKIDRLEVWAVGPEPIKEEEEQEPRPSILDVDMEGAAMLKMLNRGPVSEGMRETPTADSPEEKELPPLELTY